MDFSKLTNRSRAAIAEAEAVARTYSHQEVDSLHLIKSLLEQEQGLVAPLLERSEFPVAAFRRLLDDKLAKRAKVEGVDGYVGRELKSVLDEAFKAQKQMKDDFVSVEHLLLGVLRTKNAARELMGSLGIDEAKVLSSLEAVRGGRRWCSVAARIRKDVA